jgi:hypothetical protein
MKFRKKERISDAALVDAIERVERGLLDADLGEGSLNCEWLDLVRDEVPDTARSWPAG